jgi:hypothetical protein
MSRTLVENARRRKALKRGDGRRRPGLDVIQPAAPVPRKDLLALDEALSKLAASHSRPPVAVPAPGCGGR